MVKRAAVRSSYLRSQDKYKNMVKTFYTRWAGVTFGQAGKVPISLLPDVVMHGSAFRA